jgi:hypothetical protein
MIRKLVVNMLYDWAALITHVADTLCPMNDEIWRERVWRQWDCQRHYVSPCPEKSHYATRPTSE